ncbi:inactive peptidyl-prolyl cis-trans isomerase FKBP6 isoform X2 [Microcaecilia unicolor]|uniref:peptidylprolyl isomerase n=1 Tax=Microcaecilia unicolor TaxID=1415580 RepID=A0A6P7WLP0_9AMPH|nr:inactive peptidyl-prolyl cis-trans isomerase FKBP6 isoform X2 [Microcaecilia unicolor]
MEEGGRDPGVGGKRGCRTAPHDKSLYQQLRSHMQDISGDGGVLKEVIRAGTGELVPPDASVLVSGMSAFAEAALEKKLKELSNSQQNVQMLSLVHHCKHSRVIVAIWERELRRVKYSGYLGYSDKPFDTNWYRKNLRLMKLGEDITLGGMEIALLTMQKGEVSRCFFLPAYAYGKMGCPPLIPANSTVFFELELLDFLDTAESDRFFDLSPQEQYTFPLEKVLKVANTEREFGNYLFRQSCFYDAKDRYKRASKILTRQCVGNQEQHQINASRLLVFLNLSLTYLKLDFPARALVFGERALEIDCKNAKALFRCGQLLQRLHGETKDNVLQNVCFP